jgi:glycosyltransferase involved in cell wall biosynthesis
MPSLSIGMATYKDFPGTWACLQGLRSLRGAEGVQFLVVDNFGCKKTKNLCQYWGAAKYVLANEVQGTAYPRNMVFQHADGDFVMCVDSHIGLMPGALLRLRQFLEVYPDCDDLLQGPMLYDNLKDFASHFDPVWDGGMFGKWGTDKRAEDADASPFPIDMQGLGLFVARRESWPGFSRHFRGFGGEEGYIHGKYQARGSRTLCLPFLRWYHRFNDKGEPSLYPNRTEDTMHNYFAGWIELGWPVRQVADHFLKLGMPQQVIDRVYKIAYEKVTSGK